MSTTTNLATAVSAGADQLPARRVGPTGADSGEQRIVLRGISWSLYDQLSDAVEERQHVRMTFDGRDLELMTTGFLHESYAEILGWFVKFITSELKIRSRGLRQTTWKRPAVERGIEADLCYYFAPEKLAACERSLRLGLEKIEHYPDPDLALEVDISRSKVDRPGVYAALEVPEIWWFDGSRATIEQLGGDGSYHAVESSKFLPVRGDEVYRWVAVEDSNDELAWEERLRAWTRSELLPRMLR